MDIKCPFRKAGMTFEKQANRKCFLEKLIDGSEKP